jgi:hypothetical protein
MKRISTKVSEASDLIQRVAIAGPGFRGVREPPDSACKQALIEELEQTKQAIPQFLKEEVEWIDRKAKLFEAGEFPDKGIAISQEDLQLIATEFQSPVPVWIEHSDSPLELGYLTQVEAIGKELFGLIALTAEANALVEQSDAKSLSIGLSPDLRTIREVSLVRSPRVASARIFGSGAMFSGALVETADAKYWRERFESAVAENDAQSTRLKLEEFLAEGRMIPAEVEFASAILGCCGTIEFGEGRQSVAQLLISMVERRLPHQHFSEFARQTGNSTPPTMLPEEAEFYRKNFPDIGLEKIAEVR